MRTRIAVLVAALALSAPLTFAKGGGSSHSSSSHHSSSSKSSSSKKDKDDDAPKTVHVNEYTKKDGTVVEAHERKAPSSTGVTQASSTTTPTRCATCARDSHGRILRDPAQRAAFERQTRYPHGRKGYVVDHVIPLECGGLDAPSNMQWQTEAEARAKDATEATCRR